MEGSLDGISSCTVLLILCFFCIFYLENSLMWHKKWVGETARHVFWQKYQCASALCPWDSVFSTVGVILGHWKMAPCISLFLPPPMLWLSCPPQALLTLHLADNMIYPILARFFSLAVSQCWSIWLQSVLKRMILKKRKETVVVMTRDTWAGGRLTLAFTCFFFFFKGAHYAGFACAWSHERGKPSVSCSLI